MGRRLRDRRGYLPPANMRSSELGWASAFAVVALASLAFLPLLARPLVADAELLFSASSAFLSLARLAAASAPSSSFPELAGGAAFLAAVVFGAWFAASPDSMGGPTLLSRLAFTPSLLGSLWRTAGSGGGFFRASAAIFWAAAIFFRSASFSPSCPITICSQADCFSIAPIP